MDFVLDHFAFDIGIKGEFRIPLVFRAFKSLRCFEVGNDTFTPNDTNEEKSPRLKRVHDRVREKTKFGEIYDNYIGNNADAFTGWTFNNMKTYATSRGNKGFIHYSGGLIARAGMFGIVGVNNLVLKTGSTVIRKGFGLLKKAFSDDVLE